MRESMNLVLVVLATLRLTRFVTTDKLGDWWIVQPAKRWAYSRERPEHEGWRTKIAEATECPFCVGFHLGWLVLLGEVLTRTRAFGWARPLWTFVLAALALNYVTAHVSSRID